MIEVRILSSPFSFEGQTYHSFPMDHVQPIKVRLADTGSDSHSEKVSRVTPHIFLVLSSIFRSADVFLSLVGAMKVRRRRPNPTHHTGPEQSI